MDLEKLDRIRHSLAHLLAMAALEKDSKVKLAIGPTIDNGFYYDFEFSSGVDITQEDIGVFGAKMKEFIREELSFEGKPVRTEEAREIFKNQPYKLELIDELEKSGEKITVYQTGNFVDLCRGGHVENTREIPADAFALTHTAGAYWRGDEKNKMLTRIYGLAFGSKEELEKYQATVEEAKKRDHRILGKQLEIFTFADEVGQGLVLWLPNGTIIREELEKWAKETELQWGYQHVSTPHITKGKLFEISGHLPYYKDDLYSPFEIEGQKYYLKPMNCPFAHTIYKVKKRSYRNLPLRLAEYGQVYRYERSGVLHGLMRVRGFCQNDAHIYVEPEQAVAEFVRVLEMHRYYYDTLGIKDWWVVLGVRDPKNLKAKYHGDDAMWEEAEKLTREALEKSGVKYEIEEGGAAHYGPKADIYIRSVIGKAYAIGTDQLDLYMPQRFGLTYTAKDGTEKTPYIIHRAPLGSHERMIGFLLEHFAGAFPAWLSPVQVKVLTVSEKQIAYGQEVLTTLKAAGIRAELDESNESLGKKIREAKKSKVPYVLVIGDKEVESKTVTVESRDNGQLGAQSVEAFLSSLKEEISQKR